uniref:Uncharacterized protein n=2 Tax=Stomoxys calcitrans TaxID=35570 RepID=A0A1I8PU51_STOCA
MSVQHHSILGLLCVLMVSAATFEEYTMADINEDIRNEFQSFGTRLRRKAPNQEKRDLSLAYSATNINSKEGTQVKTITVIKNIGGDKNTATLKIKPELHRGEDWGKSFKDNFNSYGVIPDVPDVDDLFEYVNKKHNTGKDKKYASEDEKMKPEESPQPKQPEKPIFESSPEEADEEAVVPESVEKIVGDAELLPNLNVSKIKMRESLINLNYSTPQHSIHQFFENYIQLSPEVGKGYDYAKPCVHQQPIKSETIETPFGRKFNIPKNNTNTDINPYLAPSITRRPQVAQTLQPSQTSGISPVFPVNSLVPPLQPQQQPASSPPLQQSNAVSAQQPTASTAAQTISPTNSPQGQNTQAQLPFPSTSQRPYVAPNLRAGLNGVSRGPATTFNTAGFQNIPAFRISSYNTLFKKPNASRSRGLKY